MLVRLPSIYNDKSAYSDRRLGELKARVSAIEAARRIPGLTIFVAGSYARREASEHSDIDLFFICTGDRSHERERRTNELEMFGQLIILGKDMKFPKFSADAKYLEVHTADDVKSHLGGQHEDARNFFTLRLLMMLESVPILGEDEYDEILRDFVESYFRDYPDHQTTFEPTFLVNDIARYWRTMLANYEHARNQEGDETERTQQKIRNFKLKYSRLTTCFATVAALSTYGPPVGQDDVLEVFAQIPRDRLIRVAERRPEAAEQVQRILEGYAEFLGRTELPTEELHANFQDKQRRHDLFAAANAYGNTFFELLRKLDEISDRQILRTLVI